MYNFAHHWDYFQNFSILTPRFMNKQSSDNINSVLKMIPKYENSRFTSKLMKSSKQKANVTAIFKTQTTEVKFYAPSHNELCRHFTAFPGVLLKA